MVPLCAWRHCPVQAALADPVGSLALSARLEAQREGLAFAMPPFCTAAGALPALPDPVFSNVK